MGPINLALPMQSTLECVAERHPDAPQLSFLDDSHTTGRADACIAAGQDFLAERATANLVDVPEKGKVFSFNVEAAACVAAALGYQDCSQMGIKVVGMPVGQWDWVKQQCAEAANKACAVVDTIMDASIAPAAPAAASAQVHPAQIAPPAADSGARARS